MRNTAAAALTMICGLVGGLAGGCQSGPTPREQLAAAYRDLEQQKYDAAFAQANAFLTKTPAGPGSAEAHYLQGRVHEAKADQAAAAKRPEDARAQLTAAANAYLRAIAATPPSSVEGLSRSGLANAAFHLDDYETAVREWAQAFPLVGDADAKAWILYRVGVCQQRLGWFEMADRTFGQVQKEFATADQGQPAARAGQRVGHRAYQVQAGTFDSVANADKAAQAIARRGFTASRSLDAATGRHVVRVGPIGTYAEARSVQTQLAGTYPDAMIVP